MRDIFLLAAYMVLPAIASLLITKGIKERLGLGGVPYPWVTRVLRWCLWSSIIAGSLMLVQAAAIALGNPATNQSSLSLVSALNLMLVVLLVPSWVGAYFAWFATPLIFWAQATAGDRAIARQRRKQARHKRKAAHR